MNIFFSQEQEANADEMGAIGDARRCPVHPNVKTSSDDGMFDAPCDECEHAMDEASWEWERDPENPIRRYCGVVTPIAMPWREGVYGRPGFLAGCTDCPEEIPF